MPSVTEIVARLLSKACRILWTSLYLVWSKACDGTFRKASSNATDDSVELSMAKMASDTYKGGFLNALIDHNSNISWRKVKMEEDQSGLTPLGQDKVELFQKGKQCAVAFSGSDDIEDCLKDADGMRTYNRCGAAVHRGFFDEFEQQTKTDAFQNTFAPFLKSGECADVVFAVGHSLGGALASVFAGCSMKSDAPDSIKGIRVDGLYTFGAPGVSKPSGQPGDDPSGQLIPTGSKCFKGKRFWNTASWEGVALADPIPSLASTLGFLHPRVEAVNLDAPLFGENKAGQSIYDCISTEAMSDPKVSLGGNMVCHAPCLYAFWQSPQLGRRFHDGTCGTRIAFESFIESMTRRVIGVSTTSSTCSVESTLRSSFTGYAVQFKAKRRQDIPFSSQDASRPH